MMHMDQTRTSVTACVSDLPDAAVSEPDGGCFDCNICLDSAANPVVTLCGHLYCWPCIFEWLRPGADADSGSGSARRQCCPVCKAALTPDALVPLYGRGSSSRPMKRPRRMTSIPRRPAVRQSAQEDDHHTDATQFEFLFQPPFGDRSVMQSTAGWVLGGMATAVLTWVLRGQQQASSIYFPSPYHLSPSQRRRHMEVERSLHQIWFFLFVFTLLCFLLF